MGHRIEEVGVAEGEVAHPVIPEPSDVLDEHIALPHTNPPVVHRRDWTVAAPMHATTGCLDVAGEPLLAVYAKPRIAIEGRQKIAGGQGEPEPIEHDRPRIGGAVRDADQCLFVLPSEQRVNKPRFESRPAKGGVETVEHEAHLRAAAGADGSRDGNRHPHRRVHRDGDGHELRRVEIRLIQRLDREIDGADAMPRRTEERGGRGDVEGLMAELVARDEQHSHLV